LAAGRGEQKARRQALMPNCPSDLSAANFLLIPRHPCIG